MTQEIAGQYVLLSEEIEDGDASFPPNSTPPLDLCSVYLVWGMESYWVIFFLWSPGRLEQKRCLEVEPYPPFCTKECTTLTAAGLNLYQCLPYTGPAMTNTGAVSSCPTNWTQGLPSWMHLHIRNAMPVWTWAWGNGVAFISSKHLWETLRTQKVIR
jgi:hypothetical protein